jgi:Fe-Mn family superoxide dismutase
MKGPTMAFTLPPLPYPADALEPSIDKMTMEIHHGKHHNAYITNLNVAISGKTDLEAMTIEQICSNLDKVAADIRPAVRNNGGGHFNHSMFWTVMAGKGTGGGEPSGTLADAIKKTFGSFADFKTKFAEAGAKRFGSGWAWLIVDSKGGLAITSTPNQDNPLMKEVEMQGKPILGVDVWEHAYYLKYQNRRPDYLAAWWDVVNWKAVEERLAKAS